MAEEVRQIPKYRVGDVVRVEVDASDKSGVGEVTANFVVKGEASGEIDMKGDGSGTISATVVLEAQITENVPPGDYYCFYVTLKDCNGNMRFVSRPGIEFRIEGVPGADYEGPEFEGWRFA